MDGFERYVEIRKNKEELNEVYDKKKNIDLYGQDSYEINHMNQEVIQEKYQKRLDDTSFIDREFYYFKDNQLLDSKAEKYRRMAADENEVMTKYANRYEYRSARKRKGYSKDASKAFTKAAKKERTFDESGKTPLQIFKAREAIMRVRLDGMIAVAKVKAKNKENEEYRISKAKYSCLTTLKDQLEHLLGGNGGTDYEKIKTRLDKETAAALSALNRYSPSSEDKWRECHGFINEKNMKELLDEAHKTHPNFTKEDVIAHKKLDQIKKEMERPEIKDALEKIKNNNTITLPDDSAVSVLMFMCNYIRRDKNGKPIDEAEQEKEEWNKRWLDVVSDPNETESRDNMIVDRLRKIMNDLPTPSEIKKKGIMYFFNKDPYGIAHKTQDKLSHFTEAIPFAKDYVKKHPMIKRYFHATSLLALMFEMASTGETSLKGDKKVKIDDYMKEYEERYNELNGLKKAPLSFEEAKDINENITEETYNLYISLKEKNQLIANPQLGAVFGEYKRKGKAGTLIKDPNMTLSRAIRVLMENVQYDENWKPITDDDRRKHKYNLELIEKIALNQEDELKEIAQKKTDYISELVKPIELPSPDQLKGGWLIEFIKNNTDLMAEVMTLTLALDNLKRVFTDIKIDEETEKKLNCFSVICTLMSLIPPAEIGINIMTFADAEIVSVSEKDKENFQPSIDGLLIAYKSDYDIYQEFKSKNKQAK